MIECAWCRTEFEPRKGGRPQRFCSENDCRDKLWKAFRAWGEQQYRLGKVTIEELRALLDEQSEESA